MNSYDGLLGTSNEGPISTYIEEWIRGIFVD